MMGMLSQIARTSVFALGRELVAWKPSGERAVFGTRAMLSVGLAVAFTYALHLPDAWWAAISAVAVTQTEFLASAKRGVFEAPACATSGGRSSSITQGTLVAAGGRLLPGGATSLAGVTAGVPTVAAFHPPPSARTSWTLATIRRS
jgi:hypothetical protein